MELNFMSENSTQILKLSQITINKIFSYYLKNCIKCFPSLSLLVLLGGCRFETEHGMQFWDDTKGDNIIITEFFINGKEISDIRGYKPQKPSPHFDHNRDVLYFTSKKDILNIKAEILYEGKNIYSQCIIDTEGDVCRILIGFNGTEKLNCACDGLSRHYKQ